MKISREQVNDMITLTALSNILVDYIDKIEQDSPKMFKNQFKFHGKNFRDECLNLCSQVLLLDKKDSDPLVNVDNQVVGENKDVQLEMWDIIKLYEQDIEYRSKYILDIIKD